MRYNLVPVPFNSLFEDGGVRLEQHDGAVLLCRTNLLHLAHGLANLVLLHMHPAVLMDHNLRLFRKRIHYRSADTVETA